MFDQAIIIAVIGLVSTIIAAGPYWHLEHVPGRRSKLRFGFRGKRR